MPHRPYILLIVKDFHKNYGGYYEKAYKKITYLGLVKLIGELQEFHGSDYSINNGSSQNAYLIEEEKTVLIDTVWKPHSSEFIDNLESEIDLKQN